MAHGEFQVVVIGEVYAQALINEALKQGVLEDVDQEVRMIGELLRENKLFRAFTEALAIGEGERRATLERLFAGRLHPLTLNVLQSMSRRNRLMYLPGLVVAFENIRKQMRGQLDVDLVSASPLAPEVLTRVKQALDRTVSSHVDLRVKIDSRLIGGMTLRIGDTFIDGSVATQLRRLGDRLKRGDQLKVQAVVA